MRSLAVSVAVMCAAACWGEDAPKPLSDVYAQWKNGVPSSPDFFPIAVWLQDAKNVQKFKDAGMNLYIGLWKGPTEEQLKALTDAGMPVICDQNAVGLKHTDDKIIVAWMHGDEPDNAQALPGGKGYGPPILPQKIQDDYKKIKEADPSRPVILNLGQGVAWDGWYGRGVRTNKPEDYPEYIKGGDIVSFDIYPAVHDKKEIAGNLWYVPKGVDRLRQWSNDQKIVWNCIECTRIGNPNRKPAPHELRAEVWMSLIHGSRGLIYFVHQFKPNFIEAGLLADAEMTRAATAINKQIKELAPVLNSPTLKDAATVKSSAADGPIDIMVKRHGGATYLFAAAMRDTAANGTFNVSGLKGKGKVEALGEDRKLDAADGQFSDDFKGYDVHLYKITTE
ncbi:MAG: hypothetical protein NTW87_30675 [Planctomycetota bacterium]|nr:hypothetical protein [Planctomycetota bacterium]